MRCKNPCCNSFNSGHCPHCNDTLETVNHVIMECPMYNKCRYILYCKSMTILNESHLHINLKNLLFPPLTLSQRYRMEIFNLTCKYMIGINRIFIGN